MKIQRTSYVIMSKDRKYILAGSATSRSFIPINSNKKMIVSYETYKKASSNLDCYALIDGSLVAPKYTIYQLNKSDREVVEVQEILTDNIGSISDGYHTFDDLYEHRVTLYIALCSLLDSSYYVWRSKEHSDGSSYEGYFTLGIDNVKGKQITYHVPMKYWKDTDFAETLDKSPEFDGHSSQDVIERIRSLFIN